MNFLLQIILVFGFLALSVNARGSQGSQPPVGNAHADSNGNGFSFVGDELWASETKDQCDSPNNFYYKDPTLTCYAYIMKDSLEVVNMELLSRDPLLIVFKRFASEHHVRDFLSDVAKDELKIQTVVDKDNGSRIMDLSRQANGSWIGHFSTPGTTQMFKRVRRVIPRVNFQTAEQWSVLSYHPGGHYAPHYDYLTYTDKKHWDSQMQTKGNRMATFLLVLKPADLGGGTVFPKINTTVIPEAGDAMFWSNMNPDTSRADQSLHGACVIREGRKIAATLWIRQKEQHLLDENAGRALFDPSPLLDPESYKRQCSL